MEDLFPKFWKYAVIEVRENSPAGDHRLLAVAMLNTKKLEWHERRCWVVGVYKDGETKREFRDAAWQEAKKQLSAEQKGWRVVYDKHEPVRWPYIDYMASLGRVINERASRMGTPSVYWGERLTAGDPFRDIAKDSPDPPEEPAEPFGVENNLFEIREKLIPGSKMVYINEGDTAARVWRISFVIGSYIYLIDDMGNPTSTSLFLLAQKNMMGIEPPKEMPAPKPI
jgi:hypothetical protein